VRCKSSSECWARPPTVLGSGSIERTRARGYNVRALVAYSTPQSMIVASIGTWQAEVTDSERKDEENGYIW